MLQDNVELAAKYLREAVPLMVKYKIPPTPYNYALWYNYVSKRDPILNEAIERLVSNHGTCTPAMTKALFDEHIIEEELGSTSDLQESLDGIVSELQGQVTKALKGTDSFQDLLQRSSNTLKSRVSEEELPELISGLIDGTEQISQTTKDFREQVVEAKREVDQLKNELKRSREEAERDPLTGLYNRRYLDRYLQELWEGSQLGEYSLIIADIDHFKSFNDNYGHLVGDQVLQRVANLLQKALIGEEFGVRYGGEEFLLVMKKTSIEGVLQRVEKIRKLIETIVLKDRKQGTSIRRISASFGVASFRKDVSPSEWLDRADRALYQAKETGRNRVVSAE